MTRRIIVRRRACVKCSVESRANGSGAVLALRCAPPMRAIQIEKPGGPEALRPAERARPEPKAHEILVKVAAAGVNRPDVLQRMGLYAVPPDASDLPGLEIAGEVVACGSAVKMWKVGDKVRIREGNFQNFEGDVESIDQANGRVKVLIPIFGRPTPVDFPHWQIEMI